MKNYSIYAFYLTAIVLVLLLVVSFFNPIKIGAYTLKDVDILSEVRKDEEVAIDSTLVPIVQPKFSDSCKAGMFCIEDYSPNKNALARFLNALDSTKRKNIRIAFYGDSFIEGDILTQDLREGLQAKYGGRGVGFVPASTVLAGARRSVTINSSSIESHWLVDSIVSRREAGIAGSYYYPYSGGSVSYIGSNFRKYIDTFSTVRIIYQNKQRDSKVSYSVNRTERGSIILPKSERVNVAEVKSNIGRIWMSFSETSGLKVYGALLDGPAKGIAVDNFAMRGNSGYAMLNAPQQTIQQTDSLLSYRLVVLQYGLNAMQSSEKQYTRYKEKMVKTVEHIKACFPNADILILGVSDRSTRKAGKYVTMPTVPYMINAQREVAAQTQVAFWDTFSAMGGENSMETFVKAKPPKAAKDYTHLSYEGGKDIGGKLLEALLYEKTKHDEKKAYGAK